MTLLAQADPPENATTGWMEALKSSDSVTTLLDIGEEKVLPLLQAILVLLIGWIVAKLIAAACSGGLRRTGLTSRIATWLDIRQDDARKFEICFGRTVFWVLMLFVLVAFFEVLKLTQVTGPLETILDVFTAYLPRLFAAGLLALLAWSLATLIRNVVRKVLGSTTFDRRLADGTGKDSTGTPVSETVANTIYWLILVLFLPTILEALHLEGLLAPVSDMVTEILGYLPQLFGAILILVVGWFVARVVQRLLVNLLASTGVDRLGERAGLDGREGRQKLSAITGIIVFSLIYLLVLVSALNALQFEPVTRPATVMIEKIFAVLPHLVSGALVLTISIFIGRIVARIVRNVLSGMGFDQVPQKLGLTTKPPESAEKGASALVSKLVFVAVLLLATLQAFEIVGLNDLSQIVRTVLDFGIQILLGIFIFAVGLYLAKLARNAIQDSGVTNASLLANLARWAILIVTGTMALRQAGLADDVVFTAFVLLIGAVCLGGAIAIGVAFGSGGREGAQKLISKVTE